MKQPEIKDLLQELIDKDVNLDQSAKILWQMRAYMESCDNIEYAISHGKDSDVIYDLKHSANQARLQLEHYMVEANISDALIGAIVRPKTITQ